MEDKPNKTIKEYLKRITVVLDFMDKNLESDLSLESVSKRAHYSPFHFHRVFSTIIGENLNQYVIRKKVERIASILITNPKKPIKELAYSYGFKSESSFSRTFRKYYGVSPTKFKSDGKHILSKNGIAFFSIEEYICSIDNIKKWIKMNSKIGITELKKIKLAGISRIGEFEKMNDTYQKLMIWGHKEGVIDSANFKVINIYHDNPNVTQMSQVRYSACITINQKAEADGEIRLLTIQSGIYVVGKFEIAGEDISKAWKNLNSWVIENGYEFRDGDFFEVYYNDHYTHPELKFILDICIPIEKTNKVKLDKSINVKLSDIYEHKGQSNLHLDYHQLVNYMKELRAYFNKEHKPLYTSGKINQGSKDHTYFSLTPEGLKQLKLKFVIVLDHISNSFTICLSGQNKTIRKKYWQLFNGSDWNKYHLAASIDNSLMIINYTMIVNPDLSDTKTLTQKIEKESLKFMNELREILE